MCERKQKWLFKFYLIEMIVNYNENKNTFVGEKTMNRSLFQLMWCEILSILFEKKKLVIFHFVKSFLFMKYILRVRQCSIYKTRIAYTNSKSWHFKAIALIQSH